MFQLIQGGGKGMLVHIESAQDGETLVHRVQVRLQEDPNYVALLNQVYDLADVENFPSPAETLRDQSV
jgi:hypothetical protein